MKALVHWFRFLLGEVFDHLADLFTDIEMKVFCLPVIIQEHLMILKALEIIEKLQVNLLIPPSLKD